VTTSDVIAATTVYYTPYIHDLVPLCDGAYWATHVFTELSLALDADSGDTGYQQKAFNFDLFVVRDGGMLRLGTGPAWTSDTARGTGAGTTEIERVNGIWTNKVSMTLRFGSGSGDTLTVPANHGTYVGTMRASGDGQAADTAAHRLLWNVANRAPRAMRALETTDSWRQMNGPPVNQLAMVRGLDEDVVIASATVSATSSMATFHNTRIGFGLDATNAVATGSMVGQAQASSTYVAAPKRRARCYPA
jgi:hypothetical protein